jgi:ABC-2 type transport system permease protein
VRNTFIVLKRELVGYFATPVAYVFIVIFLVLSGVLTFYLGGLYENEQASLQGFFGWHPWLYLFLIPAISMRLWAEERKQGTIELLMTLPMTPGQVVTGKFLAAWIFCGTALVLTFPTWITINYLGKPDNGVIVASYVGSFLMAGGYLAIGAALSAISKNQVIAFILGLVACLLFLLLGYPPVRAFYSGALPPEVAATISDFSFLTHWDAITRGVIDARDFLFFASLIVVAMFANAVVVDVKKAD